MDFKEYQELSGRTRSNEYFNREVLNYALGMVCEAGEVGDIIKKMMFHGHDEDPNELKKELGDTLWYLANLCSVLGYSLEEIAEMNIEKLKKRYPNGFDKFDSINRKE